MAKDLLTSWLDDAYEMERAQVKLLEQAVQDFDEYEEIKTGLAQHLKITQRQADDVKRCLESLGEGVSSIKQAVGGIKGLFQGITAGTGKGQPAKTMAALYAGEQYEYACYTIIMTAAQEIDQEEIAEVCARIASEERSMADWAEERLPEVVADVVMRETVEYEDEL